MEEMGEEKLMKLHTIITAAIGSIAAYTPEYTAADFTNVTTEITGQIIKSSVDFSALYALLLVFILCAGIVGLIFWRR